MATRCRIGKLEKDGTVKSISCHWDGYLEYVGKKLYDFYDKNNIDQLLDLGDLSCLGNNPVSDKSYWKNFPNISLFDDLCVAYNDRGENTHFMVDESEEAYFNHCNDTDAEFAYLLKEDGWYFVKLPYFEKDNIKLLKDKVKNYDEI